MPFTEDPPKPPPALPAGTIIVDPETGRKTPVADRHDADRAAFEAKLEAYLKRMAAAIP